MSELKREQLLAAVISGRGPAFLRGVNLASINLSGAGWLIEADLRGSDLSNANLKRANLKGANLEMANLHSANLTGANLAGANLFKVRAEVANLNLSSLRAANLKGAKLVGANLVKADLQEADLEGADLEGANLEASNLTGATITNVNFKMANLDGVDFTGTILERTGAAGIAAEDGSGDFHGTISSIRLADLFQIGCLSRSSLNIAVFSEAGQGNIYLGSGRVLHADINGKSGEEAFMEILGWEKGRFITYPCTPSCPITIDKPVQHLVLQWIRLQDEKRFNGRYSSIIEEINNSTPIRAQASEDLVEFFKKDGKTLSLLEDIEITDVFYPESGDDILCSITVKGEALIAPLKSLNLDSSHRLHHEPATIS
jgi:uncharacterized protein YjbI with pentapeptide repeats